MLAPLEEIISYTHPAVVKRYQRDNPAKAHKAEEIFTDLMRFFWASHQHIADRKNFPHDDRFDFIFIMDEEMREIDQMWHVFLLYTQDYMDFCDRYFGEYLHHLPDIVPNLPQDPELFQKNLEKFLDYVYENLGEEVLARWYNEETEESYL